ncbi:MAG: efflux RND transporter periplasmic adaptor subunit [Hyphomicrobiaceae bacterium]|nr:efflux RND transporter periplasmic adaptor subunit [Hyphomicrobiaceae bacterium]
MRKIFNRDMTEQDWTITTLVVAAVMALVVTFAVQSLTSYVASQPAPVQTTATPLGAKPVQVAQNTAAPTTGQVWEASAPGRIEPRGGRVNIRPEASGIITQVFAAVHDRVKAGDILAILKDEEIRAKLEAARAEVAVRLGERDEEPSKNALVTERRKADDALAAAERRLYEARMEFDRLFIARRSGAATDAQVEAARAGITQAKANIAEQARNRATVLAKPKMPQPTRLDSGLQIARSELKVAELAYERTRVRAPVGGTVIGVDATVGEGTSPSSVLPLVVTADMTVMEVKAELDERDVSKVTGGQAVVIRSNAFPGQSFGGKVVMIKPALGSPALKARGPRKPSDVDVLEVKIALDGQTPLMPGMRVDVFFKPTQPVKAAAR